MRTILLINPNTSPATTALMLAAATPHLPPGLTLRGVQASHGPAMITDAAALTASAKEVIRLGTEAHDVAAIIVAAFGDPGAAQLRATLPIPVIGIGESALREAAAIGRFGIATTTPGLADPIRAMVDRLGLTPTFTGLRIPKDDPLTVAANPARQTEALAEAVEACLADGAATVVIGGGPLSGAATELHARFGTRVIAPLPAAMRTLSYVLRFQL